MRSIQGVAPPFRFSPRRCGEDLYDAYHSFYRRYSQRVRPSMSTPMPLPEDVSLNHPNPARMYDFFLGGHHNFEVDRRAAEAAIQIYPDFPLVMRSNRAFLRRAVQFLVAQGIDQFLDIGSGIPTVGNVHEVA